MRNLQTARTYNVSSNVATSFRVNGVSAFDAISRTMRMLEQRGNTGERLRIVDADANFVGMVYWRGPVADVSLIDGATDSVAVASSHGRAAPGDVHNLFNPRCPPNYRHHPAIANTFGKRR